MTSTVAERIHSFSEAFGKTLTVGAIHWRYYRLGTGPAILMLPGGLRRVSLGFEALVQIARRHTVVALDLPSAASFGEFLEGFDAILRIEGIGHVAVCGQSYGGLLAQAYAACRPEAVERLILSSTGPADYGRVWLPLEHVAIVLARVLPDRGLRRLLGTLFARALTVPDSQRGEWRGVVREIMEHQLSRADVLSQFAVMADIIRRRIVRTGAFGAWPGRVVVLAAENDSTQGSRDRSRFEALFGRSITLLSLGSLGHTAALMDPAQYAETIQQALK